MFSNTVQTLKNRWKLALVILILALTLPLTVFLALKQQDTRSRASGESVSFHFNPQTVPNIRMGQNFSVDLNIDSSQIPLAGVDTTINIDTRLVDYVSFTPSSYFDQVASNNYSNGLARVTLLRVNNIPVPGVQKVGTITLHAKSSGVENLTLSNSQVVGLNQQGIVAVSPVTPGSYTIQAGALPSPTSIISPTPSPTRTPSPTPTLIAARYEGYVDRVNCIYLTGWSADRNHLSNPVSVDVYIDGRPFTTRLANHVRSDVGAYLGDNGAHGFDMPAPKIIQDGKQHLITIYQAGTKRKLLNNDRRITCPVTTPTP